MTRTLVPALFGLLLAAPLMAGEGLTLYVSPTGNDAGRGTKMSPFATFERARDELRKLKGQGLPAGGAAVELQAGVYERTTPFELTAAASGTAEAPVTWRARGEVRVVGGKVLSGFTPVTDAKVLAKLDPAARGKVLQCDLKAQGVTDFGPLEGAKTWAQSSPGLELFFAAQPMTIARWPNEGFVTMTEVLGPTPVDVRGTKGTKEGIFRIEGDRPKRWVDEPDAMVHGYWFWDWADMRHKVKRIDAEQSVIEVEPPYCTCDGYRKGQWFYAYNLLSELDQPGEWYLDRRAGILYFWPTGEITRGKPMVSIAPSLVTLKDVSHLTLRGLTFEACRGTAITASGGSGLTIAGCTIRNVGGGAISVSGGDHHTVTGCDITQTGDGGISAGGGDRKTLTPCGHVVDNNHIHHYSRWNPMYKAGVSVWGVGCRVSHNLIDNAPHMAIGFGGNDHVIEYNEIHSVCFQSNDAGAMYTGRNWTMRGHVIRYNYLHDFNGYQGRGCVGVYLDDQFSSAQIYGNLFVRVTRAAMIGGGRDCSIENNIFVDCVPATHVDDRGLGWAAPGRPGLEQGLKEMPTTKPPWSEKYPQLLTLLDDDPMAPKGNTIARNICVGGRWGDFSGRAKPLITFEDNLLDQDPKFVDAAKGDYRLRDDSPALKLGFKPLPYDQMGLYRSPDRASWPVKSVVRPMVTAPPPAARKPRTGVPVASVPRRTAPVLISGVVRPEDWPGQALVLEQGADRGKQAPASLAFLQYDEQALYLAFDNTVEAKQPLRLGGVWGQDDAVELALRPAGVKGAPIVLLRGYPTGKFESSAESEAPAAVVKRATEGVAYAAKVVDGGRWTATWRIPWPALGVNPAQQRRLEANLSVRKTAGDQWLMWQGTGGRTWEVDQAGVLELAAP